MKYLLTIVITTLVVGFIMTAYFKGWIPALVPVKTKIDSFTSSIFIKRQPTPFPLPDATFMPEPTVAAAQPATTVKAGGILVFKSYTITIPSGWQYTSAGTSSGQVDKLTLTKDSYTLTFTQAAFGGSMCLYPGDPEQPMATKFNGYSETTTATGEKLRVGVLASGNRAVCEFQNDNWSDLTEFGHIDITNPPTPDAAVLEEINSILSSIKKG